MVLLSPSSQQTIRPFRNTLFLSRDNYYFRIFGELLRDFLPLAGECLLVLGATVTAFLTYLVALAKWRESSLRVLFGVFRATGIRPAWVPVVVVMVALGQLALSKPLVKTRWWLYGLHHE